MSLGSRAAHSRSRTAHEYVRTELRSAILNGELADNTRLLQSEIGRQLGVSTTPVREALRDLATEGLVIFDAHRGALVRALSLGEVREIYQLRMVLEPLLVERVVDPISNEALDRAHTLWQQMEKEADTSVWVQHNHAFHMVLAEPAAGSRLFKILKGLRDTASKYVGASLKANPDQRIRANAEHGRMLELFRQRDTDALAELTIEHLHSTLTVIESEYDPGRMAS